MRRAFSKFWLRRKWLNKEEGLIEKGLFKTMTKEEGAYYKVVLIEREVE